MERGVRSEAPPPSLVRTLAWGFARVFSVVALVVAWEALARSGTFTPFVLPSLSSVLVRIWEDALSGELAINTGLTVYRALHDRLPNEHFVYLGDTARVPYGTKSLATVERYAVENAQFLAARGIKLLVVACNTASALALPAIRQALAVDVVGVIGPGARAAVSSPAAHGLGIGVIATESTVQSEAYTNAIEKIDPHARVRRPARQCSRSCRSSRGGRCGTPPLRGCCPRSACDYLQATWQARQDRRRRPPT